MPILVLIETKRITVCVAKVKSAVRKISSLFCGRGHACCVAEAKCYLEEVKSAVCYRLYQLFVRGKIFYMAEGRG
jgi:hypothetical protein